jgi:hypothetical protein
LFEGFWGDLGTKIKEKATEAWASARHLPANAAKMFIMLYRTFTAKKGEGKMHTYQKAIRFATFNKDKKKLVSFLDKVITFGPQMGMPNFAKIAENAKKLVGELSENFRERTPTGCLGITALAAAVRFILNKLGSAIDQIISSVNPVDDLKEFFKEKMMESLGGALNYVKDGFAAAMGDVTVYWEFLSEVAGGAKFVFDLLEKPLKYFEGRGGFADTMQQKLAAVSALREMNKRKTSMKLTKQTLEKIIKEEISKILAEAAPSMAGVSTYSKGAQKKQGLKASETLTTASGREKKIVQDLQDLLAWAASCKNYNLATDSKFLTLDKQMMTNIEKKMKFIQSKGKCTEEVDDEERGQ